MEVQAPGTGPGRLRRATAARRRSRCAAWPLAAAARDPRAARTAGRATDPQEVVLTPEAAREARAPQRDERARSERSKAQRRAARGRGRGPGGRARHGRRAQPGAPTDAEVRTELREARQRSRASQHLEHHRVPADRPAGAGAARRHRDGARRRARRRQARDPGRQRDRQVPVQVGRRPRRLARQRLRLLGIGLVRAGGRRPPGPAAHLGAVHELRRARARALDHDLREPRPIFMSWPACASTRAARAVRAPAGRRTRARPRASRCATSRGCRPPQTASSARLQLELHQPAGAQQAHLDRRPDQLGHHQPLQVLDALDGRAVDLEDQVLGPDPGALGRAAVDDLDHLDAAVAPVACARACGGSGRGPPAMPR